MIYIPFVYFLLLFICFFRKKGNCLDAGGIITAIYVVGSLGSIVAYNTDVFLRRDFDSEIQLIPTFLYLFLLTLSILPFYRMNSNNFTITDDIDHRKFIIIGCVLIFFNLFSFFTSFDTMIATLGEDFQETRRNYYVEMATASSTRMSQSLWYYIISSASEFFAILLLFYFVASIKKIGGFLFRLLLLVSSLTRALISVIIAGRTQVIYWIMLFVVLSVTFWHLIEKSTKKRIFIILSVVLVPFAFYFMMVTDARFGGGDDSNESIIVYSGQTYPEFCKMYHHYQYKELTFDRVFPITTKYLFGHNFNTATYRERESARLGMETGTFFTFLGDAMLDFGVLGMIIYTLLFVVIANATLNSRRRAKVNVPFLIIMVILMRQVSNGYFAYVYKGVGSSLFIIGSLIIAYLLSQPVRSKKNNNIKL